MVFENEGTWFRASSTGKEEEFHSNYDEAARRVKQDFGRHHPMYISGQPYFSKMGEFPDTSPADRRIILGYFQKAAKEDVNLAVEAAAKTFPVWSRTPFHARVETFRRASDIMSERKFDLAALMTIENGKNRFEAMADVDEAIDMIRYYCEQMEENRGFDRTMGKAFPNEKTRSILKPYGVWGVIPPFNFPLAIAIGMSTGAMLTGNTIILKPASDTPFVALRFYEVMIEAGLLKGVMNYVTGLGGVTGVALVDNPKVAGIAFTGSKDVGVSSYIAFSKAEPKPFIAEMGGKNAAIVTANSDLELAAEGVVRGAFGYGGQKCSATSRVYVDKRIKHQFVEKLVQKSRVLKVGDPLRHDVSVGPLINEAAVRKYQESITLAKRDGKVLAGGQTLTEGEYSHGLYVLPTVVDKLPKDHRLFKEELFVPILCVAEVDSLEEALKLANDAEYGLTAGIFTRDQREIEYFFGNIESGVVYANRGMGATTGAVVGVQSFVGWKRSGSTGKGAGGPYYLQQFMREQSQSVYL